MIGAIALLLLLFFASNYNREKKFNWKESYLNYSKQPYGTYVLYELLEDYFTDYEVTTLRNDLSYELIQYQQDTIMIYMYVGEDMYIDSLDTHSLLSFVANGNQAFIAAKFLPYMLFDTLAFYDCQIADVQHWRTAPTAEVNFVHPNLSCEEDFTYLYLEQNSPALYAWRFYKDSCLSVVNKPYVLGVADSNINFIQVPFGGGNFYLHTQPLLFANLFLLKEQGIDYASKALSHLEEGPIYWDEFSRFETNSSQNQPPQFAKSPLSFILATRELHWAWYLALSLILLYFLFRAKRRQRIIPILETPENNSLEFIKTVGRLYFQQQNHRKLILQQMRLFLGHIRTNYHLSTKEKNEELIQKIVEKSQLPATSVQRIFESYQTYQKRTHVSEDELVQFNQYLTYFYSNAK